jgi:hypothetical protein
MAAQPNYSEIKLDGEWDIYVHNQTYNEQGQQEYTLDNYIRLPSLKTVEDLHIMLEGIKESNIIGGNIGIMRKGIQPTYEQEENRNGGAWTIQLSGKPLIETWKFFVTAMTTGNILNKSEENKKECRFNGIFLRPRPTHSNIQLWTSCGQIELNDFAHAPDTEDYQYRFRMHIRQ